ncbi:MAG TPA: hypothetical protein VJ718_05375 [Candidatus Binataceae bacterium]|nr:hypothetical protein [Candidatus Binataceae bacterium]
MKVHSLCVRGFAASFIFLSASLALACAPLISHQSADLHPGAKYDLAGVWIGMSKVACTPVRIGGLRRCGSIANIMFTILDEPPGSISGFYTADSDAFEETGRVTEVPMRSARLWLRVMMNNHSSCLFNSSLQRDDMEGSYLCFHNGSSFERGFWMARRTY